MGSRRSTQHKKIRRQFSCNILSPALSGSPPSTKLSANHSCIRPCKKLMGKHKDESNSLLHQWAYEEIEINVLTQSNTSSASWDRNLSFTRTKRQQCTAQNIYLRKKVNFKVDTFLYFSFNTIHYTLEVTASRTESLLCLTCLNKTVIYCTAS